MFATLFVGQFDPVTQLLDYTIAGHSPVIYCRPGGKASLLKADSTPIGILPVNKSKNNSLRLAPGDALVVGTDGLSEARNTRGEMFGNSRLLAEVRAARG